MDRPLRKIIHIDMDAYYASVEQRDNPEYRGKPIIVGGSPDGRGVVATASYEARVFGIRSAMSSKKALQLCPHAIFVYPRFDVYKKVSGQIREIFRRYTDLIEPLSLDEAYLDVTVDKKRIGSAIEIATEIKKAIKDELELTASAGVSINKFVAKIASDMQKPDGLTFIGPSRIESFIEQLPVEKFFGVGKVTAAKMKGMNLHTGADLKKLSVTEMTQQFGKAGEFYFKIVRGIDERSVEPHRETKSIGAEDTFPQDLSAVSEMKEQLEKIAVNVNKRLLHYKLKGRTITLKVKFSDFKLLTRSHSLVTPTNDLQTITEIASGMLEKLDFENRKVRLLGITLSNFNTVEVNPNIDKQEGQLKLLFE